MFLSYLTDHAVVEFVEPCRFEHGVHTVFGEFLSHIAGVVDDAMEFFKICHTNVSRAKGLHFDSQRYELSA